MTKMPFVSVVIPAYNHQSYVRQAILSVLEQDYADFEVIVIDDGSTDKTPAIAEEVLSGGKKPYNFVRQENMGAHAALNVGVGLANGEFISILNSDDFYLQGRLSRFVTAALENRYNFLFSKVLHVGENGKTASLFLPMVSSYRNSLKTMEWFPTKSFELLRYNYTVSTGNFFFSRKLYDKIGGFDNYGLCHDWDFILKALLYEEPFFIDEFLMSYRIHGKNTIIADNKDNIKGEIETEKILLNYFQRAGNTQNYLAPCRSNWGSYWSYFVKRYMAFAYSFESLIPYLL